MPESTDSTAARSGIPDPIHEYRLKLVINEKTEGDVTEVSGLTGEGVPTVRAIPGQVSYTAVALRFGLTASKELMARLMASTEGKVSRRNI